MEGAYRFIRNEQIKAEDIVEAGFYVTAQEALKQQTLFAPDTQSFIGLIEQQRWTRDIEKRGQRHQYATRPYKEKESYKREQASRHVADRLGDKMSDVISVCVEKPTSLNTSLTSESNN
ncbi:Mobile element protein [Vibrio cyclitrophicus FF75]|nr:Mobile element protein [Vibrio cyclitrophicus FF75]